MARGRREIKTATTGPAADGSGTNFHWASSPPSYCGGVVDEEVAGAAAGAASPSAGLSSRTSNHCCVVSSAKWTSAGVVSCVKLIKPVSISGRVWPSTVQAARWVCLSTIPSIGWTLSVAVFWNEPEITPCLLTANCKNIVGSAPADSLSCVTAKTPNGIQSSSAGAVSGTLVAIAWAWSAYSAAVATGCVP